MSGLKTTSKPVSPRKECGSNGQVGRQINGIEEDEDAMAYGEGEVEAGVADWRVRAGPRNKPTTKEREEHEATHMPFRDWCPHCLMGRGRTYHHVSKTRSEDEARRPRIAMDCCFHKATPP